MSGVLRHTLSSALPEVGSSPGSSFGGTGKILTQNGNVVSRDGLTLGWSVTGPTVEADGTVWLSTRPPCQRRRTRVAMQRISVWSKSAVLVLYMLASVVLMPVGATAQALADVKTPDTPLVLKAQGSFYVGGESVEQTQGQLGNLGPGGHITINQIYVRFMVPQGGDGNVPVVMLHGATLTGKSWETTPDGRMGWDEYFVRKGYSVYVPDQVGRGRSGFNQAVLNDVRAGVAPADKLPPWLRFSDEVVWPNFRFGAKPGEPFADTQFPVSAVGELSKQAVPDISFGFPQPNPNWKALADLAGQLKGAVLMGHSQSGSFPLEAALLNPSAAKGLVLVEPGRCPASTRPTRSRRWRRCPSWSCSAITATRRRVCRRCPPGSSDTRCVRR